MACRGRQRAALHAGQDAGAMNTADLAIIRIFLMLHFMFQELPLQIKLQQSGDAKCMLATAVEHIETAIIDMLRRVLNQKEWNAPGTGISGMFGRAPEGIRNMRTLLANPKLTHAEQFAALQKETGFRSASRETTRENRVQTLYETLRSLPDSLIEVAKNPVLLQTLSGERTVAQNTPAPSVS